MTVDRPLTEHARERLREEWAKAFRGGGPKMMVLDQGIKLHKVGEPGNDGLVPGAEFCAA
jgi:hypothetical protein